MRRNLIIKYKKQLTSKEFFHKVLSLFRQMLISLNKMQIHLYEFFKVDFYLSLFR